MSSSVFLRCLFGLALGLAAVPAHAQLSENPEVRSRQLIEILDSSISTSKYGGETRLGKVPCNAERHRRVVEVFKKRGFLIEGLSWGGSMTTYSSVAGSSFNIAAECVSGKRDMTLRPFAAKVALDPKALDLMADVIATDFKSDFRKVRPALETCLRTGETYTEEKFGFWCHTPTATVVQKASDYRVFMNTTKVDDFDK